MIDLPIFYYLLTAYREMFSYVLRWLIMCFGIGFAYGLLIFDAGMMIYERRNFPGSFTRRASGGLHTEKAGGSRP
jgi:hypothetical protein